MKKHLILLLLAVALSCLAVDSPARPNIIFILSDDVGLGNISCYGGAFKTPNIDALAKGGTCFEYCYANPVCGPSRATCLTGRYVFRTGMLANGYTQQMRRADQRPAERAARVGLCAARGRSLRARCALEADE